MGGAVIWGTMSMSTLPQRPRADSGVLQGRALIPLTAVTTIPPRPLRFLHKGLLKEWAGEEGNARLHVEGEPETLPHLCRRSLDVQCGNREVVRGVCTPLCF